MTTDDLNQALQRIRIKKAETYDPRYTSEFRRLELEAARLEAKGKEPVLQRMEMEHLLNTYEPSEDEIERYRKLEREERRIENYLATLSQEPA